MILHQNFPQLSIYVQVGCKQSSENVVFWNLSRTRRHHPRRRRESSVQSSSRWCSAEVQNSFASFACRWHNSGVANVSDAEPVLRQKLCGNTECRAVFTICVACDRGQRYCCHECRSAVRRQQRKEANRRYQQREAGKQAHRRCQRRYRGRPSEAPVTDQGGPPIASPSSTQPPKLCRCAICGRQSSRIDPFPTIPWRYRSGRRSKNSVSR
jgi:hypothetical protein